MRKTLTAEQTAARDARRAKFRALWQTISKMPELERVQMAGRFGFRTCEGREFSLCNSMLLALQCPGGSVFGGFRQWLAHGRAVRKGEHGAMIWVPCGGTRNADMGSGAGPESQVTAEAVAGDSCRFIIGTVFDIGQTEAIETEVAEVGTGELVAA